MINMQKLILWTHLITKNFDLTVTSVRQGCVSWIFECVDLNVQWKTLEGDNLEEMLKIMIQKEYLIRCRHFCHFLST